MNYIDSNIGDIFPISCVNNSQLNRTVTCQDFLRTSNLTAIQTAAINRTVEAIGYIWRNNRPNGSALLIGRGFILVSAHCFPDIEGSIFFRTVNQDVCIKASTLADGRAHQLDYKILFSKEAKTLPSSPLSVAADAGQSLQINYKADGKLYITPYEPTMPGNNATWAASGAPTSPGDSGGCRFSMGSLAVHAIHQGQGHALKLNDIYQSLIQLQTQYPRSYWHDIFTGMNENIVDPEALGIDFSTVVLHVEDVVPEHGTLIKTLMPHLDEINPIPSEVYEGVRNFLFSIVNSLDNTIDFYSKIWGDPGQSRKPLYQPDKFQNGPKYAIRLDRESPLKDEKGAANIQFQYGKPPQSITIATVLVSDQLAGRPISLPAAIVEVVNFVVGQFIDALEYAQKGQAIRFYVEKAPEEKTNHQSKWQGKKKT